MLFCLTTKAQAPIQENSYHISIDLQNITPDKDRIKITILTPPIKARTIRYTLPAFLPGINGKVDAGRFVHQFYAIDDKGFPLKVSKNGNNVIVMKMRKGATLKKIEYWVDDTWDAEKTKANESDKHFNYIQQAAGSNFEAGSNFVLNHAFLFGYIEGFSELPYTVNILKPIELSACSALKIKSESQTRDSYHVSSYKELVENPVMYCRPDTVGFMAGNIRMTISVFSENGKVTARLVRRLISTSLMSDANFISELEDQNYTMMFYFTTPFRTILNSHGKYGGIAHHYSSIYFLPELADEDELSNEIQRETAGDLFHLLRPLDPQSMNVNSDFLKPQLTKNWWFYEGVNLYFNWLAEIRDSTISENEFMGFVSSKIRLAEMANKKPITDLKNLYNTLSIPLKREAMRSKAMLLALLLDIKITDLSKGQMDLRKVVMGLNEHKTLNPDSIETLINSLAGVDLKLYFLENVNGIKALALNESLSKIGWAYSPMAVDSMLSFGSFGLLYNDNLDAFFVSNSDTTNAFGLKDGDRIVSVNQIIVNSSNFDAALHEVYTPSKNTEVELRFIRIDQNYTVKGTPAVKSMIVQYLIRKDPAADMNALHLHDQIFAPNFTP